MEEKSFLEEVGTIAIIVLVLVSIVELTLLGVAWYYDDEVDCNLLWCTFTMSSSSNSSVYSNSSVSLETITTSTCYINRVETNCSELEKDINWSEVLPS